MLPERARELCQYLQKELRPIHSFCEALQNDPILVVSLYNKLNQFYEDLQNALYTAFPDIYSLKVLVERELGAKLAQIPAGNSYFDTILNIIEWAESEGCLLELIAAAYKRKPQNPPLRLFVIQILKPLLEEISPDADLQSDRSSIKKEYIVHDHLISLPRREEALIQPGVEFVEVGPEFGLHKRCICRVEVPVLKAEGTGFLLRKGIVITSYHVMRPVLKKTISWEHVAFRFEYIEDNDGKHLNRGVEYALADDWCIESSEALDYILLRLNNVPSSASFMGRNDLEQRKFLTVKEHNLHKDEELWIIQHPLGIPLRTTALPGRISRIDNRKQRVYYTTRTQNGSSGSPCVLKDGTVVALHCASSSFENEGIFFSAILADLCKKGVTL